uniref:Uncharacterized protein n=1 Tax=Mustela putorius furo TaxID=9669 RepID=M3XY38_MUSPF
MDFLQLCHPSLTSSPLPQGHNLPEVLRGRSPERPISLQGDSGAGKAEGGSGLAPRGWDRPVEGGIPRGLETISRNVSSPWTSIEAGSMGMPRDTAPPRTG